MKENFEINSNNKNIKLVVSEILGILKKVDDIDKKKIFEIRLCVEETLINAIKHGNKFREEAKIKIDLEVDRENFKISVEDEGKGFNYKNVPDPTVKENIDKSGGRGVFLIRNFMDEVQFNQRGNKITMVKKLRRGEPR